MLEPLGASHALFLDFDGTLVDIADHPGAVRAAAGLPALLAKVSDSLGGALALVSGRRISDLDRILAPFQGVAIGLHGLEQRHAPGAPLEVAAVPNASAAIDALREGVTSIPGAWIEDKGLSAAIHFRSAPHAVVTCGALAERVARAHGLEVLSGKMVYELRRPGVDKGSAVAALLALPTFRDRAPVFVGDDVTDEDAFAVVQAAGGRGVKVGSGATIAAHRVRDVAEVIAWLQETRR